MPTSCTQKMLPKVRAIDWWYPRGQATLQKVFTSGKPNFVGFCEKLSENKLKNVSKMVGFAKREIPRLQGHLQKNPEVISKIQRQFEGGRVDCLHGAKRIGVIALTVRSVGGHFFSHGLTRI